MLILLILFFLVSMTNSTDFLKSSVGGISVLWIIVTVSVMYYIKVIASSLRRGDRLSRSGLWCLAFCMIGAASVIASFAGAYRPMVQERLFIDDAFISRQAYYLFFLPILPACQLSDNKRMRRISSTVRTHPALCFTISYVLYFAINRTFAPRVNITLLLCAMLLTYERKTLSFWFLSLLVMLSPVGVGGELTQIAVRAIFLLLAIVKDTKFVAPAVRAIHGATVACVLLTLMSGVIVRAMPFELDANSSWRLNYWADEASSLAHTLGIGVGYGTSYASAGFVAQSIAENPYGPFYGDASYTATEKLYVLGSHNSFVSVAFRMGLVGIAVFLWTLGLAYRDRVSEGDWASKCLLYHCGILITAFNVGLESPLYLFTFLLCIAMTVAPMQEDRFSCKSASTVARRRSVLYV